MPYRIEIALKEELFDAEGEALRLKAKAYFGINLEKVRTITWIRRVTDWSAGHTGRWRVFIGGQTTTTG